MNRNPQPPDQSPDTSSDNSWESDAVWKLLDHGTQTTPSPRFLDDTLRAIRLEPANTPWWKRILSPIPLTGLATAAAAITLTVIALNQDTPTVPTITDTRSTPQETSLAAIQDIAEAELLNAAIDHLDDFSDHELVSLIGL
jgi:hypothetical protein